MSEAVLRELSGQVVRFGLVGIISTLLHMTVAFLLHYGLDASPQISNFTAFCFAWAVSYTGHFKWTFGGQSQHRDSAPKFMITSLIGLALNLSIVWLVSDFMKLPFYYAIGLVVTIIPIMSFFLSKFWAFKVAK